jgi:hypothetical protein
MVLLACLAVALALPMAALAKGDKPASSGPVESVQVQTREEVRRERLVALAAVIEKSRDSIKVVGTNLKTPVVIKVGQVSILRRRGKTVSLTEVSVGSAIVLVAERASPTDVWEATKIIVLKSNTFRKIRISVSGVVSAVNTPPKTITITARDSGTVTLLVENLTLIARNLRLARLSDLRVNDRVTASYRVIDGTLVAVRIRARSR